MLQSAAMANEEPRPPRDGTFDPFGGPRLEVRTPEAIAITRPIAGFGSRSAAICIDIVFVGILGFGVVLAFGALGVESTMALVLALSALVLVYFTFLPA